MYNVAVTVLPDPDAEGLLEHWTEVTAVLADDIDDGWWTEPAGGDETWVGTVVTAQGGAAGAEVARRCDRIGHQIATEPTAMVTGSFDDANIDWPEPAGHEVAYPEAPVNRVGARPPIELTERATARIHQRSAATLDGSVRAGRVFDDTFPRFLGLEEPHSSQDPSDG